MYLIVYDEDEDEYWPLYKMTPSKTKAITNATKVMMERMSAILIFFMLTNQITKAIAHEMIPNIVNPYKAQI
jgi:hypothetical protein